MMRRIIIGGAFLLIALLTLIVWAVSQFIQPILPSSLNSALVLFFVALLSVVGFLAGFKDTIELLHWLFRTRNHTNQNLAASPPPAHPHSYTPPQPIEREHNVYKDEAVTATRTLDVRRRLNRSFDDPQLDAFLLDYFPEIYDRLSRGMQKDEKLTLLLDHCRRSETRFQYLLSCLERTEK